MVKRTVINPGPDSRHMVRATLEHLSSLERRARLAEDFPRAKALQIKQVCIQKEQPVILSSYELPWSLRLAYKSNWLFKAGTITEII